MILPLLAVLDGSGGKHQGAFTQLMWPAQMLFRLLYLSISIYNAFREMLKISASL